MLVVRLFFDGRTQCLSPVPHFPLGAHLMLSRVSAKPQSAKNDVQDVQYQVATTLGESSLLRRHSTCGLTSVSSEVEVTTRATVADYAAQSRRSGSYGELPILRSQYVARGVRVLFGSRWRLHRFQERTIKLNTGEKPSLVIYAGQDTSDEQPKTTYVLGLDTICELTDRKGVSNTAKTSRATGIQLSGVATSSGVPDFRLRIRFVTPADAKIWCSIIQETLKHAKWSQDTQLIQGDSTRGRNIYVVQHSPSSKKYVVKVLAPDMETFTCRELHNIRLLYSSWFAQGVSLMNGYRVVETVQETLLIMPQVPGSTLLQLLRQRRSCKTKLTNEEAWRFVGQLATLLQAVHQTGIVHCDLNLENVLVTSDLERTSLIDFGGAFDLLDGENSTRQAQQMTGTPGYIAPERVQNPLVPPTPKADVFSFGILLFQALSGQNPYIDASREKRALQLSDSLNLDWAQAEALLKAKAVSPEFRELISQMLTASPRARISLDEVRDTARRNALFAAGKILDTVR